MCRNTVFEPSQCLGVQPHPPLRLPYTLPISAVKWHFVKVTSFHFFGSFCKGVVHKTYMAKKYFLFDNVDFPNYALDIKRHDQPPSANQFEKAIAFTISFTSYAVIIGIIAVCSRHLFL